MRIQSFATATKTLAICLLALTFAAKAQTATDYLTDGKFDSQKLQAAIEAQQITAEQAQGLTQDLIASDPAAAQEIASAMATAFPDSSAAIRTVAVGALMANIQAEQDKGQSEANKETQAEQVDDNKLEIAFDIAFQTDNATLHSQVGALAARSLTMGATSEDNIQRAIGGLIENADPNARNQILSRISDFNNDPNTTLPQSLKNAIQQEIVTKYSSGFSF